jgi:plastocyanin
MARFPGGLESIALLGFVLFVFSGGFPPFDDAAEVDLTLHMLQHVLIILAGVMISYPLMGRRMLRRGGTSFLPQAGLAACAVLLLFWHLPGPWDAAVIDPFVHVFEHLSFLAVGLLSGSWLLRLSDSAKIGALVAGFFGHMGYAVVLISPWNAQVYALYPLGDQVILGWVLLLSGPTLVVGIAYVIARNPEWLEGYSGEASRGARRDTILNRAKVPRWVVPLATVIIILTFVVYLAATAYALSSAREVPGGGPEVYIEETPVSWQYTPQSIKVVLGVNATVTWVSHSISYDTVTDRGGSFSSGTIAPGQIYTHTFTTAGAYDYFCQYHPWMTGRVTVLPQSS